MRPWASVMMFSAKSSPLPRSVLTDAVVAERRVRGAVGAVAGEQEVAVGLGAERGAGDQDLPGRGEGDAVGQGLGAEGGGRLAGLAEGSIEVTVGGVAGQGEVVSRGADDDDPAVGLEDERAGIVGPGAEVGGHDAVVAERHVRAPVGVVAHEREVGVDARRSRREAGDHDLAVRLHGHGVGLGGVAGEDVGGHDPAAPEAGVRHAVGQVAHEGEVRVLGPGLVRASDGDDAAVRRQRRVLGLVVLAAQVGDGDARGRRTSDRGCRPSRGA